MINALKQLKKAYAKYNPTTGEGANELLKAYIHYQIKCAEVDAALKKVGKIYGRDY